MKITIKEFPKECPFCHITPSVAQDPLWHGSHGYKGNYDYYVTCTNENCKVQPKTKVYSDIYMTGQECVDKAIADWNDR